MNYYDYLLYIQRSTINPKQIYSILFTFIVFFLWFG